MKIEQDIWQWITDYVEVNHKFYDYRFPPCPYARAARMQGLVDVRAYGSGGAGRFVEQQAADLVQHGRFNVCVLAFPYWMRWNYLLRRRIARLNTNLIRADYYAQFGAALGTHSQYPGLFKDRPYFIVIINKLSDVLAAQTALERTDYYSNWTDQHYHSVVVRRKNVAKGSS
jgi:hypothetical protein